MPFVWSQGVLAVHRREGQGQTTANRGGRVAVGAVAQLSQRVAAPAFEGAIGEDGARVGVAGSGDGGGGDPVTVTGVSESVLVPSPSWPQELSPQHLTVPSARRAQEWKAGGDGGGGGDPGDRDRGNRLTVVAVAQLAGGVVAPAFGGAVGEQGAV